MARATGVEVPTVPEVAAVTPEPISDEELTEWRERLEAMAATGLAVPGGGIERALAVIATIDAERARADAAEARVQTLLAWGDDESGESRNRWADPLIEMLGDRHEECDCAEDLAGEVVALVEELRAERDAMREALTKGWTLGQYEYARDHREETS